MTLSFCCIHKFVMVVIKPVRHSCPNNLVVIIRWLGWVSHMVSWLLWTPFCHYLDVSFPSSSRSNEMQHIWGKIQIYYFWNRDCYRAIGFRNLTVPGEVLVKLFSNTILFFFCRNRSPPLGSRCLPPSQLGERHIRPWIRIIFLDVIT